MPRHRERVALTAATPRRSRSTSCSRGRLALPLPLLRRFLERQPDHPRADVALARVLTRRGRHLEAVASYDRAIAHEPVAVPSHYLERARALVAGGAHRRAGALRGLDEGMRRLVRDHFRISKGSIAVPMLPPWALFAAGAALIGSALLRPAMRQQAASSRAS